MTAYRGGRLGEEGSKKKEKGLMDKDNSVVIAGDGNKGGMVMKNIIKNKMQYFGRKKINTP